MKEGQKLTAMKLIRLRVAGIYMIIMLFLSACGNGGNQLSTNPTVDTSFIDFSKIYYRVYAEGMPLTDHFVKAASYPSVGINSRDLDGLDVGSSFEVSFFYRDSNICGDIDSEDKCGCVDDEFCRYATLKDNIPADPDKERKMDALDFNYDCVESSITNTQDCVYWANRLAPDTSPTERVSLTVQADWTNEFEEKDLYFRYKNILETQRIPSDLSPIQLIRPSWPSNALEQNNVWLTSWSSEKVSSWYAINVSDSTCLLDPQDITAIEIIQSRRATPRWSNNVLMFFDSTQTRLIEPSLEVQASSTETDANFYRLTRIRNFNAANEEGTFTANGNLRLLLVRDSVVGWARVFRNGSDVELSITDLSDDNYCDINISTPEFVRTPPIAIAKPEMVPIQAGGFIMGSDNEPNSQPKHQVTLPAFEIGRYEVTRREWQECVLDGGCSEPVEREFPSPIDASELPRHPVVNVNVTMINQYIAWLNQKTGNEYRLPSEAEWEYAARAGTTEIHWWGPTIGQEQANCYSCGSKWDQQSTAPVGSFGANAFGLYDVHGNAYEWVADCSTDNYEGAPDDGSVWFSYPCADGKQIIRGGSWSVGASAMASAARGEYSIDNSNYGIGFRLARTSR